MDIQKTATQLVNYLGQNPELITQFIEHPYSTTAKAMGTTERISKEDMSKIAVSAAALSRNQKISGNDIANIASVLLGQNGGSVHALTNMLFGANQNAQQPQAAQPAQQQAAPAAQAAPQQQAPAGNVNLGSLVNMAAIAAALISGAQQAQAQAAQTQTQVQAQPQMPAVNFSDGLDMGEIATLAAQFLAAGNTVQQPQQNATNSVDFGTIAQIANIFLNQRKR